jgi:WD40 repeat protein
VVGRVNVPGHEILSELGRGGMGVVYQARQTKLGRLVALKMILSGAHAGATDLARFRTEAEAVARLQHTNIVQIFEVGEHDGLPYFSLEFCGGGSLERKLNGTPLPPREAVALVEQLARAMHAAHQKGVVHRDLKPANVLLADDGTPKVTDFGLAKKLDEAGQTATGSVMGTPSYMAPEQAGGKSGEIGPAADVYALGAILYECLTGRPPFKAATAMDTLLQVVADDPLPPTRLAPRTPRDMEIICLKCLQKEPQRRYAGADGLADDLRHFLSGEPITARPVGTLERAAKWVRRRPAAAALLGVSVVAAFGFGLLLDRARREADARRAVEADLRGQAESERDKAADAWEDAQDVMAHGFLEQARAVRLSRQPGRRWQALELLGRAEQLRSRRRQRAPSPGSLGVLPTLDQLRREAVAALLLEDARPVSAGPVPALARGGLVSEDGRRALVTFQRRDAATGQRSDVLRLIDLKDGRTTAEYPHPFPDGGGCTALSPDGTTIAVVAEDGSVQLLGLPDEKAGKTLPALKAPGGPLEAVEVGNVPLVFSRDSRYLLAPWGNGEQTDLFLWDLRQPAASRRVTRVAAPVLSAAFRADGQAIACLLDGTRIAIVDLGGRGEPKVIALPLPIAVERTGGDSPRLYSRWKLSWSPTAPILAVVCQTSNDRPVVVLWDTEKGQEFGRWDGPFGTWPPALSFHPGGKSLAAGDFEGTVTCFDLAERRETLRLEGAHHDGVAFVCWLADGRMLSKGIIGTAVKTWEPAAPLASAAPLDGSRMHQIAYSRDGRWLALLREAPRPALLLLDRATGRPAPPLALDTLPNEAGLVFRPDGRQLALVSREEVTVWDVPGWKVALQKKAGEGNAGRWLCAPAFLEDGRLLVASAEFTDAHETVTRFRVSDVFSGREAGPPVDVSHAAASDFGALGDGGLSGDGRRLIALPAGIFPAKDPLLVWDVGTGQKVAELKRPEDVAGTTTAVRMSPDGKWLAQDFWPDQPNEEFGQPVEPSARLWDVAAGRQSWQLPPGRLPGPSAFSPDSRLFAVGYSPSGIEVWDVARGVALFRWDPPGMREAVTLAFAPDGTLAAIDLQGPLWTLDIPALRRQLDDMGLDW